MALARARHAREPLVALRGDGAYGVVLDIDDEQPKTRPQSILKSNPRRAPAASRLESEGTTVSSVVRPHNRTRTLSARECLRPCRPASRCSGAMGKPPGSTHAVARDALEAYKQARLAFVNSLNEMLRKDDPSLDAALLDGECLALLHRPLAQDIVPGIQTSALAAMRALASRVDRAGDVLATPETLGKIVSSLSHADPAVVVVIAIAGRVVPARLLLQHHPSR